MVLVSLGYRASLRPRNFLLLLERYHLTIWYYCMVNTLEALLWAWYLSRYYRQHRSIGLVLVIIGHYQLSISLMIQYAYVWVRCTMLGDFVFDNNNLSTVYHAMLIPMGIRSTLEWPSPAWILYITVVSSQSRKKLITLCKASWFFMPQLTLHLLRPWAMGLSLFGVFSVDRLPCSVVLQPGGSHMNLSIPISYSQEKQEAKFNPVHHHNRNSSLAQLSLQ